MSKKIFTAILTFGSVMALLFGCLILTTGIPNEKIKENLLESALYYRDKDAYAFREDQKLNGVADNYADAILLNVLWNMKDDDPVRSSLDSKYYDGEEYGESWGLYQAIEGHEANTDYTRYWHGFVVLIRPLLLFTDAMHIRMIMLAAVLILAAVTCVILIREHHPAAAVSLVIALAGVQIWNIRLALEYQPMFLLCFALCPFFLLLEKRSDHALMLLSVVSGTMAAFFDFLTTETVTILIPLILVFFVRAEENRLGSLKHNLILSVQCGLHWGLSYAGAFLCKWTAASAAAGQNKFIQALTSAETRFAGTQGEENLPLLQQIPYAVFANLSTMFGGTSRVDFGRIFLGLLLVSALFGSFFYLFRRDRINKQAVILFALYMAVPYVRYLVLNNHSWLHEFFTYRAQAASILALCAIVWCSTDRERLGFLRKNFGKKKGLSRKG